MPRRRSRDGVLRELDGANKRGEHIVLATTTEAIQSKLGRPTRADWGKLLSSAKVGAKAKPVARTISADEFTAMKFEDLVREIKDADRDGKRIVLDTTDDAVAAKLDQRYKDVIAGLQKHLGTIAIDEAVKRGWQSFTCMKCPLNAQVVPPAMGIDAYATQRRAL
jgi:hypothetical protein